MWKAKDVPVCRGVQAQQKLSWHGCAGADALLHFGLSHRSSVKKGLGLPAVVKVSV